MKLLCIYLLGMFLVACSNSPEFTATSSGKERVLLSYYYGDLLLQVIDQDIDASWDLDVNNSTASINGVTHQLTKAKRQEYITKQNGFAYLIYLSNYDEAEGEYIFDLILRKGNEARKVHASYNMEIKSISAFNYLNEIFKQRSR